MGGNTESEKHDAAAKAEKEDHENKQKNKHEDEQEKTKDKKKKDKDSKEKKVKNPEDKKDPAKLKAKLQKIETKMHDLQIKKDEILKLISEAESNPAPPPSQ